LFLLENPDGVLSPVGGMTVFGDKQKAPAGEPAGAKDSKSD